MLKHLWVRLMAALAVCLFTVTAFAAEVADAPVAVLTAHPVIAVLAVLLPALQRALREDVSWFSTLPSSWRLAILAGLTVLGTSVDQLQNGANLTAAIVAALLTGGPALVIELVHLGRGGPGAGKPASPDAKSAPQPTPYSAPPGTKLVMLGLALAALTVIPGCASIPKILTVIADVTSIVQEAQSLAASARDEESQYFLRHPNAEAQAKVEQALSDVEQSLAAFSRASKGVTEASLGQLDAARADFVLAWKKLEGVLRDLGVMHGNKIAGSPGAVPAEIREPMLLTAKLHS